MLTEQNIEFQLRDPGAPWPYMYSNNWLISRQNKNLERKSSSGLLFIAKILQEAVFLASPFVGQKITYN